MSCIVLVQRDAMWLVKCDFFGVLSGSFEDLGVMETWSSSSRYASPRVEVLNQVVSNSGI
jgi:hypothetical protein